MEKWEQDFYWLKVRHFIKDKFKTSSLPDVDAILFLIGIQDLGGLRTEYNKEEKMQLMHNGTALLFAREGYFERGDYDDDGWPVWKELKSLEIDEKAKQEKLKELMIDYFSQFMPEEEGDQG